MIKDFKVKQVTKGQNDYIKQVLKDYNRENLQEDLNYAIDEINNTYSWCSVKTRQVYDFMKSTCMYSEEVISDICRKCRILNAFTVIINVPTFSFELSNDIKTNICSQIEKLSSTISAYYGVKEVI